MDLNDFGQIANTIESRLSLGDDFSFSFSQKFGAGIKITQKKVHKVNILSIGFTKYNYYKFETIAAGIAFIDLNKLLAKIFPDIPSDSVNIKNSISERVNGISSGENVYPFLPLEINSEEQVNKVSDLVNTFINEDAYPFFDQWKTLHDLIPVLEKLNPREISEILGGNGVPEKALIWYLSDHPEKEGYLMNWINKYETKSMENPDEDAYKEHLDILLKIKQVSKSILPLSP